MILGALMFASLSIPPAFAQDCGRPLKEVRARWRAVEHERSLDACREKQTVWLELRKCFAGGGDWLPWPGDVGDCFLENRQTSEATAFYRRVLRAFPRLNCTHDGLTCGHVAVEELRRLACGFSWLAEDARRVWSDLAAAQKAPETAAPTAFHLEPVVDVSDPDDPLSDVSCVPGAFAVPKAILRNARLVSEELGRSRADPLERVISFELTEEDRKPYWSPTDPSGRYGFLRLQVCPYVARPVGLGGARYYLELNLAPAEERYRRACSTAYSWSARRLGLALDQSPGKHESVPSSPEEQAAFVQRHAPEAFRKHRLPAPGDLKEHWRDHAQEHGHPPVFARGDFDGDGALDLAFLLPRSTPPPPERRQPTDRETGRATGFGVFCLLSDGPGSFHLVTLEEDEDSLLWVHGIEAVPPGTHTTLCGLGGDCPEGGPRKLVLTHEAINLYAFEKGSIVFAWDARQKRFRKVWMGD